MDPAMCKKADWRKIGSVDGRNGRPLRYQDTHEKVCGPLAEMDAAAYSQGWDQGRMEYCTPENIFQVGAQGDYYSKICPADKETKLLEQHEKGFALYRKNAELKEVQSKIERENERRQKDKSVANHVSQAFHMLSGTSPTAELDKKAEALTEEVNQLEAGSPARIATPATESNQQNIKLTVGALVGTFLGFGSGHAIQGRYAESGWKWTAGEVATFGTMIAVSNSECSGRNISTDPNTEPGRCASAWPTVAALGWIGFRVWESIDLFRYSARAEYTQQERPPRSYIALQPHGATWFYSF